MRPEHAREILRAALLRRPELRWINLAQQEMALEGKWIEGMNPYQGFCYIATEAFCALVPEAKPYQLDRAHFWAQIDDEIWDLTGEQFETSHPRVECDLCGGTGSPGPYRDDAVCPPCEGRGFTGGYPYALGKTTRFKQLSWRAFELIREADPIAARAVDLTQRRQRV